MVNFVGEFGGFGNIQSLVEAMQRCFLLHPEWGTFKNPWYFPSPDDYKIVLESAGFTVEHIELIPRPTPLESGVVEWLKIFANHCTSKLTQEQYQQFLMEVEQVVKNKLYNPESGWFVDYVRLRFVAKKA